MSRIGKKPVPLPAGVTANDEGQILTVKGPKGTLSMQMLDEIVNMRSATASIRVTPADRHAAQARAAWGMQRTNVAEPRHRRDRGLHQGARDHRRRLPRPGPGQEPAPAARLQPRRELPVPEGVDVKTSDQNTVEISGIDKQKVGQVAAEIRRWRKPEPYKGKGIKYRGEYIFRKEGKKK